MTSSNRAAIGLGEFVGLMATLTALAALTIDMVLPALPAIGATLNVERANDNQLVVSLLFLGFGIGQLLYGPLSDAVGRKPAAYAGLTLFTVGCLLSLVSSTFPVMLAGRLLALQDPARSRWPWCATGSRGAPWPASCRSSQ